MPVESSVVRIFRFSINFEESVEAMVDAGHYEIQNPNISNRLFEIAREGVVECEARYLSSREELLRVTARANNLWVPARVEHLLAYGATFPEEQRARIIIGIGSVVDIRGCRFVPFLGTEGQSRCLGLRALERAEKRGASAYLAVRAVLL